MVFKILEDDSYIRCILVGSLVDHENWPLWTRCGGRDGQGGSSTDRHYIWHLEIINNNGINQQVYLYAQGQRLFTL